MRTLVAILCLLNPPQEKPATGVTALRHAKVYTVSGAPIEGCTILIEAGKISALGKDVPVPAGAAVLDLSGKVVIPGLVDAASRLMLAGADRSPGSAEHTVLDALDRYEDGPAEAVKYGVTSVYIGPVGGGPVQGLGAVLQLTGDRNVLLRDAALKVSLASPPGDSASSAQRYEIYQQLRQAFEGARQYRKAREKYAKDLAEHEAKKKEEEGKKPEERKPPAEPPKVRLDPRQEVLLRALDPASTLRVRIEVHTVDAIELALKLVEEFKLKAVLEYVTEGGRAAEAIARAKVPVVAGPVIRYGLPAVDFLRHTPETPAALARGGVPVALGSFGDERAGLGAGAARFLLEAAAVAASRGLKKDAALAAVTLQAARALGLEKSIGSVEKGKLADLVILSGEPFDVETVVERTLINGATVYTRGRE